MLNNAAFSRVGGWPTARTVRKSSTAGPTKSRRISTQEAVRRVSEVRGPPAFHSPSMHSPSMRKVSQARGNSSTKLRHVSVSVPGYHQSYHEEDLSQRRSHPLLASNRRSSSATAPRMERIRSPIEEDNMHDILPLWMTEAKADQHLQVESYPRNNQTRNASISETIELLKSSVEDLTDSTENLRDIKEDAETSYRCKKSRHSSARQIENLHTDTMPRNGITNGTHVTEDSDNMNCRERKSFENRQYLLQQKMNGTATSEMHHDGRGANISSDNDNQLKNENLQKTTTDCSDSLVLHNNFDDFKLSNGASDKINTYIKCTEDGVKVCPIPENQTVDSVDPFDCSAKQGMKLESSPRRTSMSRLDIKSSQPLLNSGSTRNMTTQTEPLESDQQLNGMVCGCFPVIWR